MSEPVRLRDDPDLSASLRADLAEAAAAAPMYDAGRGLERLSAAIAIGGPPGAGGGGQPGPAGPSHPPLGAAGAAKGAAALKAAAVAKGAAGVWTFAGLGVASAVAISVAVGALPGRVPPAAAPTASAMTPPPASALVREPPSDDAPTPAAASTAAPTAADAPERDMANTPAPRSAAPAGSAREAEAPPSTLNEEVAQLAEVRAAAASNPARALALAEEGQRRFHGGVFAQEREAIAISSLAALGRTSEARARADRFLAQNPNSPLAERVRRATRGSP